MQPIPSRWLSSLSMAVAWERPWEDSACVSNVPSVPVPTAHREAHTELALQPTPVARAHTYLQI